FCIFSVFCLFYSLWLCFFVFFWFFFPPFFVLFLPVVVPLPRLAKKKKGKKHSEKQKTDALHRFS
ncbi:MAG: hypothetical protein Q4B84_03655, partial [Clostridia bacterium]|nr:hypothetical protein [Clostridia bacterium]